MRSRPSALGDFTVDRRVWLLTGVALLIGAGAAGLAVLLLRATALATNLFYYHRLSLALVGPAGSLRPTYCFELSTAEIRSPDADGITQVFSL